MKKIKKWYQENLFSVICILIVCIILIAPLLSPSYVWGHDSAFHISNIKSLVTSISKGNWFFPKIYPIIANNFGYGTGLFYGQLPHMIVALLKICIGMFFDISIIDSMKIVHFVTLFCSAFFMYLFTKKVTNKKLISLVGAIIYITFPYRLSEIYVRDAFAENITFVFLPLIFYGLYELLYGKSSSKFYIPFIIGTSALVLTHTITTFYTALIVFIYLLFNFKKVFKKDIIKKICIALSFIFFLTSFYTIPLIEQKLHANINIFTNHELFNSNNVSIRSLFLSNLFPFAGNQSMDGIVYYLLIPTIMMLLFSIYNYKNIKLDNKEMFLQFFIIGSICLLMTTNIFPWKYMPKMLLYIQFPWRLLVFVTFFYSLSSILILITLKDNLIKPVSYFLIMIFLILSVDSINLTRLITYTEDQVNASTSGIGAINDYLPSKVLKNYEYYNHRGKDLVITSGSGDASLNSLSVPFTNFDIYVEKGPMTVEFPMLYYYGYTSYCTNKKKEPLEVKESKNGFVEVVFDKSCNATLNFTGSTLTKVSYYLTLLTLITFIYFVVKITLREKNVMKK
ncbi:MAG: hypothetical protein GX265_04625 [Mollicutes bacterium]|nr:hypothetical protein [Mollicutes bacterium]